MSLQQAVEFSALAMKDPALTSQVNAALAGKSPEACAAAFAELGKSKGYDFTLAEAMQVHDEVMNASQMSDEDLEKVAGGMPAGFVSFGFGQAFAALFPGGQQIGQGIGRGIETGAGGGSSHDVGVAIMGGINDGLNATRNAFQSAARAVFSGW